MTRKSSAKFSDNHWMLQDAKARFSEVVRRARDVGPQHVSVHGREQVVILSEEEYGRLKGSGRSGADLIAALQALPGDDLLLDHERIYPPVRDVEL